MFVPQLLVIVLPDDGIHIRAVHGKFLAVHFPGTAHGSVKVVIFFENRSYTPLKLLPHPMGQFTGHVRIPSTSSISSRSS